MINKNEEMKQSIGEKMNCQFRKKEQVGNKTREINMDSEVVKRIKISGSVENYGV